MVKILSSADLHMSNKMPHARPSTAGRTDRLDDQLAMLAQMRKVCADEKVDAVLLLGDIFDQSKVDAVTLTHTVEEVVKFPCPTYILPGNHDAVSIRGGRFTVEAFGAMGRENIKYIDGGKLRLGGVNFWPLPYMPAGETRQRLDSIRSGLDPEQPNVLLFHNSILGCTHIGWKCDDGLEPEEVCKGFDWVLSGHFHDTQRFGPGEIGMYLGAPMHHHFGDVGRPAGFWLFDFKGKKRTEKFIQTEAPQFYQYDDLDAKVNAMAGDYVRFRITATHADWALMKLKAKGLITRLESEGVRADCKHDPIYHHESRIGDVAKKRSKAAAMSMDEAVAKYVSADGVEMGGLDRERLKAIGREALAAVRGERGTD